MVNNISCRCQWKYQLLTWYFCLSSFYWNQIVYAAAYQSLYVQYVADEGNVGLWPTDIVGSYES